MEQLEVQQNENQDDQASYLVQNPSPLEDEALAALTGKEQLKVYRIKYWRIGYCSF